MADDPTLPGTTEDDIVPLHSDRLGDAVIDLAGFRLTRGRSTRSILDRCKHRHLIYAQTDRRIRCEDCQRDLDPFDALMALVGGLDEMVSEAKRRLREATEARKQALVSRAAKAVDEVWRGRNMAPCCPHCSRGLLPEDFAGGASSAVSREYEAARRAREKQDGKR